MRIIFFDLDGTLINSPSTEKTFLRHLITEGKLSIKQYWHAALFVLRWFFTYKQYVFIKDKAYLSGLPVAEITALAVRLAYDELLKRIRPDIQERLLAHQKAGDVTVLITGSHEFIAKIFAEHLDFDAFYGTKCAVKDGYFTAAPPIQHPFRDDKLAIAKKVCAQYQINIKDCVAYGDSFNDSMLLHAVGQPIVVKPDYFLHYTAHKEGWEILGNFKC